MAVEQKTCQKYASSLIVCGLLLFASLLSLSRCLSSSASRKREIVERMARKLLYKNGGMTMGLLKPLGHPNAHPIDVIDFPFC